jgi:hypothetical protein
LDYKVDTYTLISGRTGKPVRQATKVTGPDGRTIKFIDRLSNAKAIEQAKAYFQKHK